MFEHRLQRLSQALQFRPGQPSCSAAWTDAGPEEAFIRIDVTDSGEQGLVEQGCLDGQLATSKEGRKLTRVNGERLFAGSSKGGAARKVF